MFLTYTGTLIWPFIRISAMFMAAPIFGAKFIPVRVRLSLALAVAWLVYPVLPPIPAIEPLSSVGFLITIQQIAIGLAMGFIMQMVFGAVVIAGQSIAMSMGLGFASAIDPQNGVQVPVVSQFFVVLATLVFLGLNGHLLLIQTLVESFHLFPVALNPWPVDMAWQILRWSSNMFTGALLIALPVVSTLLLVNLAFGIMTRAAPQLNIFAVGFPITILAGFIMLLLSLPGLLPQLTHLFSDAFQLMRDMLV